MQKDLYRIYFPITATPFERSAYYAERQPCGALKPYIRCFWGTPGRVLSRGHSDGNHGVVIPDTCMDIIFDFDCERGEVSGSFCAIDENSYLTGPKKKPSLCSTFAVRFYSWSAALFSDGDFTGSKNRAFDPDSYFNGIMRELGPRLFELDSLEKRAEAAEEYLLKRLNLKRFDINLMNSVYDAVSSNGRMTVWQICRKNVLSGKRLERLFAENIGVSPKTFITLVRYQLLWQEICSTGRFNALDLAYKYGYFDQPHLLNDFKRRHGMTPAQAIKFSRGGFLQDSVLQNG